MSSQSIVYENDVRSEERTSQSTRTKIQANFQMARPAPKFSLRLAPRKLLQIQQLVQNHRPVPVLEFWQPLFHKSKVTRDFCQRVKLRTGDIYATIQESYITSSTGPPKDPFTAEQCSDGATPQKHIVAAMCQSDVKTSNIHFRDARCSWQASTDTGPAKSTLSYRFIIKDKNRDTSDPGRMIMQWEKRSKESVSAGSLGAEQFVLFLIDRGARRKSRIATMTPDGVEISIRKSSILEHLQECFDLMQPIVSTSVQDPHEALETWLYTQTLALGAWVAYQEGWLNQSRQN
ncbi:hypothetical protein PITC_030280 [Penicillium italicum]|uniref:Uncharacterized protein n=1 Tax=Penicillium italicum TaxID=40296 RepID=A0A0A2L943_PENIT|nr:hypothetical protein PITC_030280 [Penicillium italicum]